MKITQKVKKILSHYSYENVGTQTNIARILMSGKLAGTGKMVILPVDQGFEHGPARSFQKNPAGYDPEYHHKLAVDAGLNAYAAPLGMLQLTADKYYGQVPLILKVNSSNSLHSTSKDQAITSSIQDALELGCSAIGFTIYPASEQGLDMFEEFQELAREAKSYGLAVVLWSYPRGNILDKNGEIAVDVCAYAAHMAALLGANIIKVKPPQNSIGLDVAKESYKDIKIDDLKSRISHIKQCCFEGKRLVVFSGGNNKSDTDLYNEIQEIADGGGDGSIIGRNTFQRPREEALVMLDKIINIYKKK